MDYHKILGRITNFLIDLNLSNEEIMGYILDFKVCWNDLMERSALNRLSLMQAMFDINDDKDVFILSLLADRIYEESYRDYSETIFS